MQTVWSAEGINIAEWNMVPSLLRKTKNMCFMFYVCVNNMKNDKLVKLNWVVISGVGSQKTWF